MTREPALRQLRRLGARALRLRMRRQAAGGNGARWVVQIQMRSIRADKRVRCSARCSHRGCVHACSANSAAVTCRRARHMCQQCPSVACAPCNAPTPLPPGYVTTPAAAPRETRTPPGRSAPPARATAGCTHATHAESATACATLAESASTRSAASSAAESRTHVFVRRRRRPLLGREA
jgi:hypothetical protein